jgi:predicted exporter
MPPAIEHDFANLSPISPSARALDASLRAALGAPEVGNFLLVNGKTADDVLEKEENLQEALANLKNAGVIGGVQMAARLLPSIKSQRARQNLLPPADLLTANVTQALADLPFRPNAFQPFLDAVAASRGLPPLTLSNLPASYAALVQPLLSQRPDGWVGVIIPTGQADSARLRAAMAPFTDVLVVDIRHETNQLIAAYTKQAWRWLSLGGAAVIAVLLFGLRSLTLVLRVLATLASACIITLAVLDLCNESLSLVHIVALQFVLGVGLDYAVFLARRQPDVEERSRTLRTLITCNAMTLATFGLLAFCGTPLLHGIGLTVAIGAVSCLMLGFLFIGKRHDRSVSA